MPTQGVASTESGDHWHGMLVWVPSQLPAGALIRHLLLNEEARHPVVTLSKRLLSSNPLAWPHTLPSVALCLKARRGNGGAASPSQVEWPTSHGDVSVDVGCDV